MTKIISVINQKGGCGKTTTATNLVMGLCRKGHTVMAIDMDPQGHLTLGLGYRPSLIEDTILDLLEVDNSNLKHEEVMIEVMKGLFLLPANVALSTFEQKFSGKAWRESRLSRVVSKMNGKFDYIIIDAPPSLGLLTINALLAANFAVVPIDTGYYALEGMKRLQDTINMLKKHIDHTIEYRGLITFYEKKAAFSKEIESDIVTVLNGHVFNTKIRRSIKYNVTQRRGKTVIEEGSRKSGIAFHDYMAFTSELISWVESRDEDRITLLRTSTTKTDIRENILQPISFKIKDDVHANEVYVAGDFNEWTPSPLQRIGEVWEKNFNLEPGKYEYKFIVNGNWVLDPNNELVNENNGVLNSVVEVMK